MRPIEAGYATKPLFLFCAHYTLWFWFASFQGGIIAGQARTLSADDDPKLSQNRQHALH